MSRKAREVLFTAGQRCVSASARAGPSLGGFKSSYESGGAAAGVCFYKYSEEHKDLALLFLRQHEERQPPVAWTWPGVACVPVSFKQRCSLSVLD
jgi:hypothetical protein